MAAGIAVAGSTGFELTAQPPVVADTSGCGKTHVELAVVRVTLADDVDLANCVLQIWEVAPGTVLPDNVDPLVPAIDLAKRSIDFVVTDAGTFDIGIRLIRLTDGSFSDVKRITVTTKQDVHYPLGTCSETTPGFVLSAFAGLALLRLATSRRRRRPGRT